MHMRIPRRLVSKALLLLLAAMVVPSAASAAPNPGQPWKFAITDDSRAAGSSAAKNNGVATVVLARIAQDVVDQGVDFVLFPGDMVTGETDDSDLLRSELQTWKDTMKPVYDAGVPVYVTRGNHEYNPRANGAANPSDPSLRPFLEKFPDLPQNGPGGEVGLTWSFTHRNAKVVGFDQYANRASTYDNSQYAPGSNRGQAMNPWVVGEIERSEAGVNFVIAHEQIWPTDSHPDCLANDPDSRDALAHALATHNGTYLAGHDHMYVRGLISRNDGLRAPAFTVGTAGGGNYNHNFFDVQGHGYPGPYGYVGERSLSNGASPTFGYLLVTVYPDDTWSAEFRGFKFNAWNTSDVSLTPIVVMDSFTSSSMQSRP